MLISECNCYFILQGGTDGHTPDGNDAAASTCVACASGQLPDPNGSHRCARIGCNKAVHALPGCSIPEPGSEEGHGQRRICQACASKDTNARALSAGIKIKGFAIMCFILRVHVSLR